MFPAVFYCLKTDKGIFKAFCISSEWGNSTHFITKTPHQRKGSDFPFLSDSRAGLGALLHPFNTRHLGGLQGHTVGLFTTCYTGAEPKWSGILCPENLLLYIILVTFSSVTHLCTLGRGWHVADFMGGMLPVLGSALMCCNSLHSH